MQLSAAYVTPDHYPPPRWLRGYRSGSHRPITRLRRGRISQTHTTREASYSPLLRHKFQTDDLAGLGGTLRPLLKKAARRLDLGGDPKPPRIRPDLRLVPLMWFAFAALLAHRDRGGSPILCGGSSRSELLHYCLRVASRGAGHP